LLFAFALLTVSGCASYSDHTEAARNFAQLGDYDSAVVELDRLLGVEEGHAYPERFRDDSALVLLERGMLHQARGDYDGSRGDLQVADKELELLDFSNSTAANVARYFYSDSTGPYRISPVERLSLNAINILNYLAVGDLRGARVEAKRFTVMRSFLEDTDPDHAHGAIGSYLAGFVHEQLGENGRAMRHYNDALAEGRLLSLAEPLRGLAERVSVRGSHVEALLEESDQPAVRGGGEILIVAGVGRVPYKVPKRIPIGAAIGIAAADVTGDLDVLERSAFKVLIYPELVPALGTYGTAQVRIDEADVAMDAVTNFGAELVREYEEIKPRIIAAALSRMVTRAVVAEGARLAGKEVGGQAVAILAGLISEGLLVAADRPDTRSWTLLPNRMFVSRMRVTAGVHQVEVGLGSGDAAWQSFSVEVPENGYALVIVMPLH
jgi:tetratricopeptide (TPR) repeat protein